MITRTDPAREGRPRVRNDTQYYGADFPLIASICQDNFPLAVHRVGSTYSRFPTVLSYTFSAPPWDARLRSGIFQKPPPPRLHNRLIFQCHF
jgi:hypothetical protein